MQSNIFDIELDFQYFLLNKLLKMNWGFLSGSPIFGIENQTFLQTN